LTQVQVEGLNNFQITQTANNTRDHLINKKVTHPIDSKNNLNTPSSDKCLKVPIELVNQFLSTNSSLFYNKRGVGCISL